MVSIWVGDHVNVPWRLEGRAIRSGGFRVGVAKRLHHYLQWANKEKLQPTSIPKQIVEYRLKFLPQSSEKTLSNKSK